MTLDQCFQANQGTAILVPGGGAGNNGQCAQWADLVLHDVYGLPYIYTPGAIDWWQKADALGLTQYFDKIPAGEPIKKGDFLIYDARVGSAFCHIDVASADGTIDNFSAYDSNWNAKVFHDANGYPTLHELQHTGVYNTYILGYLRLKGATDMIATANDLKYLYLGVYAQDVPDANLATDGFVGTDLGAATMQVLDYANKNGFAYWQYKPNAEKQIADLTTALATANDALKKAQQAPVPAPTPLPPTPTPQPAPHPIPAPPKKPWWKFW